MNHDSIFDRVKETVNIVEVVERFGVKLNRAGKACCPFHEEKTASFSVKKNDNIFKCFGCQISGDAVDFVAKIKGIELLDAALALAEMFGISLEPNGWIKRVGAHAAAPKTPPSTPEAAKTAIKKYITECKDSVGRTDFFKKRGLTDETIRRFYLGYDTEKQVAVIPYSSKFEYYQTRSILEKKFFKPKTEEAGAEPLFNAEAIANAKGGAGFVGESPICALSIMQCGNLVLSTCGTGTAKLISEIEKRKSKCTFILCFDNDDPGQKAQQDLCNQLFERNIKFLPFNIAGSCKDPNELLTADAECLRANIKTAVLEAKEKYRTEQDSISFADLCKKKLPPLRWAIKGLFPEGLHMLASMPKVGKSWMALGMCFAVVTGGDFLNYKTTRMGTLYYSLEDNYNSAQDRMLNYSKAIGYPPPENAHLAIDAERTDTGFFAKLKEEISEHPDIGFVVVDTLQNIRGADMKKGDVYANDVTELKKIKRFAIENKLVILLIHHLRKAKDDDDPFNNILGSNGIWGTIDTGITLAKKNEDDDEAKMKFKGRGIKRGELVLTLGESGLWKLVGTPQQQEAMLRKNEYEGNQVIKTIKWLLSKPHFSWNGTATDLMMASYDMDGQPQALTTEGVGKAISKHKMDLYYDGITVEDKRSSKKRMYVFYKKSLRPKQYSFMESKEDE